MCGLLCAICITCQLAFDFDFMKIFAFNWSAGNNLGFGLVNTFRYNLAFVNKLNTGFGSVDGFMLNPVNAADVSFYPADMLANGLIITTIGDWYCMRSSSITAIKLIGRGAG